MKPSILVAFLFVASAIAGCATQPATTTQPPAPAAFDTKILSQKEFKFLDPEEVWTASAQDGMRLNSAVYRPDTTEKVPVFINFSPYWGDAALARVKGQHLANETNFADAFGRYLVQEYVPRGYAVVLSSVRGTGHSEGCFQIGGDLELKDTYDVIDYFSKQPWSNGNVAAGGKSYDSTTQNGVIAKYPHPALKGIFHVSGITDMYRYNAKDGVSYFNGLIFNTIYGIGQGLDEYGLPVLGTHQGNTTSDDEGPDSLRRAAGDAGCIELPKENASGVGSAADGMRDAYWQERNWVSALPKSTWNGSVFLVHGLQDWNVKPDNIDPWVDILQAKGIHVLGWLHQETFNSGHVYPMRQDWNETLLRWLDGTLKGVDTRLSELWGFDVAGSDGTWRYSASWPPTAIGEALLGKDGKLDAGKSSTSAQQDHVRIAGVPYAKVTVTPAHADDIARIVLYDKAPDGKQTFVDEAVRRLALSDDLTTVQPYTPAMPLSINMTFYPIDHELLPGHTWVLELGDTVTSAANGETTPPGFLYRADQVQGVTYGQVELHLPVAALDGELSPQPLHMHCFTC